jgi:hypothetical protein
LLIPYRGLLNTITSQCRLKAWGLLIPYRGLLNLNKTVHRLRCSERSGSPAPASASSLSRSLGAHAGDHLGCGTWALVGHHVTDDASRQKLPAPA